MGTLALQLGKRHSREALKPSIYGLLHQIALCIRAFYAGRDQRFRTALGAFAVNQHQAPTIRLLLEVIVATGQATDLCEGLFQRRLRPSPGPRTRSILP
ncbi:MAG: hypothetical protein WDN03_07460 [Rhizomicrobium sp.]